MREQIGAMALINYLALLQLISGLVMGIVMLMVLALASAGEDD
jgi:hypothetical protein